MATTRTGGATGSGTDIWGTVDQFRFPYRSLTGDGSITARVIAVDYVHHGTKAGVMIRESLAEGAPHAYMLVSADRGLAFHRRVTTDDISTHTDAGRHGAALVAARARLHRQCV